MNRLKKSLLAEADLVEIWLYTLEHWGSEQADLYLDQIQNAFERLCDFPESGIDYSDIRPNYRALIVGSHTIFYRFEDSTVNVVRILHQSMDYDSHL